MLKRDRTLAVVGALEPLAAENNQERVMHRKSVSGLLIGSIAKTREVLEFCAEHGIGPEIEVIPIQQINHAYKMVERGEVWFRYVIDMGSLPAEAVARPLELPRPDRFSFFVERTCDGSCSPADGVVVQRGRIGGMQCRPPSRGPAPGVDVACLLTAMHGTDTGFNHALQACGVATPDLTGNIRLQRMALAAHVPFTVRPIADTELKGTDQVTRTGNLIPYRDMGQPDGVLVSAPIL